MKFRNAVAAIIAVSVAAALSARIFAQDTSAANVPSPILPAATQWGLATDTPLANADFDGDGRADLAVFRPATGEWYIRLSSEGLSLAASVVVQWGLPGDTPIVGDYDGDGATDFVVFRPSTGIWYIQGSATRAPLGQRPTLVCCLGSDSSIVGTAAAFVVTVGTRGTADTVVVRVGRPFTACTASTTDPSIWGHASDLLVSLTADSVTITRDFSFVNRSRIYVHCQ